MAGRRLGKTTSIIKFLNENILVSERVLIIVTTPSRKQDMISEIYERRSLETIEILTVLETMRYSSFTGRNNDYDYVLIDDIDFTTMTNDLFLESINERIHYEYLIAFMDDSDIQENWRINNDIVVHIDSFFEDVFSLREDKVYDMATVVNELTMEESRRDIRRMMETNEFAYRREYLGEWDII